jgi:hypothetical protein
MEESASSCARSHTIVCKSDDAAQTDWYKPKKVSIVGVGFSGSDTEQSSANMLEKNSPTKEHSPTTLFGSTTA